MEKPPMQVATITHSTEDIDSELFRLYGLANRSPLVNKYGEPITAAIRAQIVALRGRMTISDAAARYSDADPYVLNSALHAAEWLYGDGPAPSIEWQSVTEDAA
jgi:hypothetical protein